MPEGPSLRILAEEAAKFEHRKVLEASGNAKVDIQRLENKTIQSLKTWGKHYLIIFSDFYVKVHFLMIGSYSIDEKRKAKVRLGLHFTNGDLYFYASQIQIHEGNPDDSYDWQADIMSDAWSRSLALKKIRSKPDAVICDLLLDQEIAAGSGNIIKNEALYRAKVHPESTVSEIPADRLRKILDEARAFSFEFLKWKKKGQLSKHLSIYSKEKCPEGHDSVEVKYTGKTRRKSFICTKCQKKYG